MLDLESLAIETVAIHKIPKVRMADKANEAPELSEAPVALTSALQRFFRERIVDSLRRSFDAVYKAPAEEDEDPSPIPSVVAKYFKDGQTDLIGTSQTMALELYRRQSGSSSPGMLVVADARVGTGAAIGAVLVVMKIEDDEALLIDPTHTADGKATFKVTLRPVTLPKNSRVFKTAVFPSTSDLASLHCRVADHQRDLGQFNEVVADFFLSFLGCTLRNKADLATKNYLRKAEAWVDSLDDDSKKGRYLQAVLSDLGGNSSEIDPKKFAREHLAPTDRDGFLSNFEAEDGSIETIAKERALVERRIRKMTYEFPGGVVLTGPPDTLQAMVRQVDDGWLVESELKDLRSGK